MKEDEESPEEETEETTKAKAKALAVDLADEFAQIQYDDNTRQIGVIDKYLHELSITIFKACITINGGAIIGISTLLGHKALKFEDLTVIFAIYGFGVIASILGACFSHLSKNKEGEYYGDLRDYLQHRICKTEYQRVMKFNFEWKVDPLYQWAKGWWWASIISVGLSVLSFLIASLIMASNMSI